MMLAIILALLPADDTICDHADVLERNSVYDGGGRLVLAQWVWWERVSGVERVVAWRLVKCGHVVERDYRLGGYVLRFVDGDVLRKVRADDYRETHTQYDVEIENRSVWPKELRRELAIGVAKQP